jgi:hypothetical protein
MSDKTPDETEGAADSSPCPTFFWLADLDARMQGDDAIRNVFFYVEDLTESEVRGLLAVLAEEREKARLDEFEVCSKNVQEMGPTEQLMLRREWERVRPKAWMAEFKEIRHPKPRVLDFLVLACQYADLIRGERRKNSTLASTETAVPPSEPQTPGVGQQPAVIRSACGEDGVRTGDDARARPRADGYVEVPADPTAYVPNAEILSDHQPEGDTLKARDLITIVEDHKHNEIRWTRPCGKDGKPRPNRRCIHLADWLSYIKRRHRAKTDGWPTVSEEERTEQQDEIRRHKSAG